MYDGQKNQWDALEHIFIKTYAKDYQISTYYIKGILFSVVDLLKLKGTHTVNFSSSLYIINQKPMINTTHFHCITTWVASSSG